MSYLSYDPHEEDDSPYGEVVSDEPEEEDGDAEEDDSRQRSLEDYQDYKRRLDKYREHYNKIKDRLSNKKPTEGKGKGTEGGAPRGAGEGVGEGAAATETGAAAAETGAAAAEVVATAAATEAEAAAAEEAGAGIAALAAYIGIPGCIIIFVLVLLFLVLFVIIGVGGETQEDLDEVLCPQVGNLSCYKAKAGFGPCYHQALLEAEAATDVPWQIIAAIDFKIYEQGEQDKRGLTDLEALKEIGEKLQKANYKRVAKGEPNEGQIILKNGEPIKSITKLDSYDQGPTAEDKHQDLLYAAYKMMPYMCIYTNELFKNGETEEYRAAHCYDCVGSDDQMSAMLLNPWMAQNSALLPVECDADYTKTGVLTFYNYLMDNCRLVSDDSTPPLPPGPTPGPPGECSRTAGGSNASVTPYNQCSDPWGSVMIDSCPCDDPYNCNNMCGGGCGLTSLTMVMGFYGAGVTPLDNINYVNTLNPVPYNCKVGWEFGMYPQVAATKGLVAETGSLGWDAVKAHIQNCEPIIIGVTGGGWAHSNHLVVLTGIDGSGNVFVNDPEPIGTGPEQYVVHESNVMYNYGNTIYVHP